MLENNKKFWETCKDADNNEDGRKNEKCFHSLGFKNHTFPKSVTQAHFQTFISCLETMAKSFNNCDTVILIDNERFNCHFIVLKSYSKYMMNLVDPEIDTSSIQLPSDQVTSLAFCEIYEWMLMDAKPIKRTTFAEVFKASIFLKIEQLIQQFIEMIDDNLIDERCALSIFLEARKVDVQSLQTFMAQKFSKIFLTFVASQEFLDCSFREMSDMFRSNRLGINSELDLVFIAVRWLSQNWPKRKKWVEKLIRLIKLELIDPHLLIEINNCDEWMKEMFQPIQEAIDDALSMQIASNRLQREKSCDSVVFPRMYVIDPLWEEANVERTLNFHDLYSRFKKYLKKINACHWIKINYRAELPNDKKNEIADSKERDKQTS